MLFFSSLGTAMLLHYTPGDAIEPATSTQKEKFNLKLMDGVLRKKDLT